MTGAPAHFTIYEARDETDPDRQFVCLIALKHLGDIHAIRYGPTYEETLAKAEETWNKHTASLLGKVDRRKTRDPMIRLQRALETLEAMYGEIE